MCILFIFNGKNEVESDYSLILASNRDEYYDRPTQNMAPWSEDPYVFGGRDLQANCDEGTWLAVSSHYKKCGVLLNLPGVKRENAKSRGRIVTDFVKCNKSTEEYIESIKHCTKECNEFVFVTVEFGIMPSLYTYSNNTDKLTTHADKYSGFGNSVPETPLRKVDAGKKIMKDICQKYNKVSLKQELIKELIKLLKCNERHLPDPQLEMRSPKLCKELSSIYVCIPEERYGTRTHTLILVTKTGHVDLIEISLQTPIDPLDPKWARTEFQFDML